MNNSIIEWLEKEFIDFSIILDNSVVSIDGCNYLLIYRNEGVGIFSDEFDLMLVDDEFDIIDKYECKYVMFYFGPYVYYTPIDGDTVLNRVSSIGKSTMNYGLSLPRLGIHTGYDLLMAQGMPKDIVKRAIFLGIDSLGLADYNSLAGALEFQKVCLSNNINSIIGSTIKVDNNYIQCYVINMQGWSNLCRLISESKCIGDLSFQRVCELSSGLFIVASHFYSNDEIKYLSSKCENFAISFDISEWSSVDRDNLSINRLVSIIDEFLLTHNFVWTHNVRCVTKNDLKSLNSIITMGGQHVTKCLDPWLKSDGELFSKLSELFNSQEDCDYLIIKLVEDTNKLSDLCKDFRIDTTRKLPIYIEDEDITSNELLYSILIDNLDALSKVKNIDYQLYKDRIDKEFKVISDAGVTDYFLIVSDMCEYCKENNILLGNGRGCFLPESKVKLSNGSQVNISNIKVGDNLSNYFTENHETKVIDVLTYHINEEIIVLEFEDGKIIKCTKDHKFYTLNRGWVEAKDLTEEDEIAEH